MVASLVRVTPVVYLLATGFWCVLVGNPIVYLISPAPAGQGLYFVSKLLGVLAITGIGWQAAVGLQSAFTRGEKRISLLRWHRFNGAFTFVLACAHMASFISAASIRSGHFAGKQLLPDFSSWYQTHVFIGVVSFCLLLITVSRPLFTWRGALHGFERVWHSLAVVVFPLGLWHGLTIGSETRSVLVMTILTSLSLLVVMTLFQRMRSLGWAPAR